MADIVFLAILIIAFFIGMHLGFIKSFVNLINVVISAFGGYLVYPFVSSFLADTPLFETIRTPITKVMEGYYNGSSAENLDAVFEKYGVTTINDLAVEMSRIMTILIINVISIIAVFLLIRIALSFFKGTTSLIAKLPIIKGVDKMFGAVVCVISALLIIYLVVAVMMIPPCNDTLISKTMCEYINESFIVKNVMDCNIFINFNSLSE